MQGNRCPVTGCHRILRIGDLARSTGSSVLFLISRPYLFLFGVAIPFSLFLIFILDQSEPCPIHPKSSRPTFGEDLCRFVAVCPEQLPPGGSCEIHCRAPYEGVPTVAQSSPENTMPRGLGVCGEDVAVG